MSLRRESLLRILVGVPVPLLILAVPVTIHLLVRPSYIFALSLAAAANLALLVFFLIRGIVLRRRSRFGVNRTSVLMRSGPRFIKIKKGAVTLIEMRRLPFGAHKVIIETAGRAACRAYLSGKSSDEFRSTLGFTGFSDASAVYKASASGIILMSVTGSNAIAGFLALASGLRSFFADLLSGLISPGLKIAALIVILSALGWLASSLYKFLRIFSFKAWLGGGCYYSSGGFFSKHTVRIDAARIHAIDIRETLLSLILKRSSVRLSVPGRHSEKSCSLLFVPSAGLSELNRVLRNFFPYKNEIICALKTPADNRFRHILPYAAFFSAAFITSVKSGGIVSGIGVILCMLSLWSGALSFFEMKRGGVKICTDCVIICGKRFFTLRTLKIRREKIDAVIISRTIFQKFAGLCTVRIKIKGEKTSVKCRHLPFERAYLATLRL